MNRLKSSMLIAAIAVSSSVFAGGPTTMPAQADNPTLFATAEGGYSWNSLGDTTVIIDSRTFTAPKTNHGGTGRIALGATHYSTNHANLSYTAEAGWGYYGQTDYVADSRGINAQDYLYGFDMLAGVDYKFSRMCDGFFKLGGLLENARLVRNTNLTQFTNGIVSGTEKITTTVSSVIPEVKVGGDYDFNSQWGLSLAYMHAFGNGDVTMTTNRTTSPSSSNNSTTDAPISLNTILAGIRYSFD